jgi:cyclopropane fatty-acyl-phospholipid synthase-like methyltransferase
MATRPEDWDLVYQASELAPWDVGRPQEAFTRLAETGKLSGRVLDAGCGTGEHTLLAAAHGAEAMGVDCSATAIDRARRKAEDRGIKVRFETADAIDLTKFGITFDAIIDAGMFHVLDDEDRERYVASLTSVTELGGTCYLMCFSDRQPGTVGPRRVRQDELIGAFSQGWAVTDIVAETFAISPEFGGQAHAWLATICRRN